MSLSNFSKISPCSRVFFDLKQFNRHKLWYPPKCVLFALFNYSSLSYIVLALSSAVTNLLNKTLIFHDFQGPTIKFLDFPLMSRNASNGENGETGEKSPAAGDLNWMPKVAPWRLAILAKMAILAKLAILAKMARGLAICGKIFKLDAKSGPSKVDN